MFSEKETQDKIADMQDKKQKMLQIKSKLENEIKELEEKFSRQCDFANISQNMRHYILLEKKVEELANRCFSNSTRYCNTFHEGLYKEKDEIKKNLKSLQGYSSLLNKTKVTDKNAELRLKGQKIKASQPKNVLKKLFYQGRYERETQALNYALSCYDIKPAGENFTLNDAHTINEKIDDFRHFSTQLDQLHEEIKKFGSKYTLALMSLSSVARSISDNPAYLKMKELFLGYKTLSCIYSSNRGSSEINKALRAKRDPHLSANDVIEGMRKFNHDIEHRSLKEERDKIKFYCKKMSYATLCKMEKFMYQPKGVKRTYYRGQDLNSKLAISQFQSYMDNGTTVSPTSFFSTSGTRSVAEKFARGGVKVLFKISGFSCVRMSGEYADPSENEFVFTRLAKFSVKEVSEDSSGMYHISLQEVTVGNNNKEMPY
ncbi:hypothetical protein [Rahnella perminowiae]|uniref:hypothetical protein n=1 Tax=Rahnella perminowiae TaxID=2816244 RepID=UPI00215BB803|nr:hypothetical protein [Rahnella perminowiae]MCR8999239.1 hypothetical protein [Rahnella perminowiae]